MNAPMLTLVGRLRRWAQERGAHRAVILLADGEAESAALTFAELDARARSIAAQLAALGARQKPVLLLCPSEIDFVASFVGCLYAGAIAVPAPTQLRSNLAARIAMVAQDAVPAVIIAADASRPVLKALALRQPVLWLDEAESSAPFIPDVSPNETAFIQYSSGSTASPKGIAITHGNLIANLEMFCAGFGVHNGSCFVNWLPLFHDMGLVGHCLAALYQGVACVMVPPLMFRQRPERWVEAMARYGGTISGAPNFAFELCARRAARLEGTPLDLHRWETAFCGAEMIRAPTMERFATALAPFGFRAAALTPAYGLAEATLFVASRSKGQGVTTRRRERTGHVRQIVSCGQTASAETIRIVDPVAALPLPDGEEGEIWVKGPHIAAGYWRRASETAAIFGALLAGDGPYLRTGDFGFLADGELYVTGRLKDIIVYQGANIEPSDIEATIAGSHEALADVGAAFTIELDDREEVVVVQEMSRAALRDADFAAITHAAMIAVAAAQGLRLHELVLVRPGSVPRTTSGKIRRQRCRELYLAGELEVVAAPIKPRRGAASELA